MSNTYFSELKSKLARLEKKWERKNADKRSNFIRDESMKGGSYAILGAVLGGLLGGPPGALVGAAIGGVGSATKTVVDSDGYNNNVICG